MSKVKEYVPSVLNVSFDHWLDIHGYSTKRGLDGDYEGIEESMLYEAYILGKTHNKEWKKKMHELFEQDYVAAYKLNPHTCKDVLFEMSDETGKYVSAEVQKAFEIWSLGFGRGADSAGLSADE